MHERLWVRVAVSFLLFLAAGTAGLLLVLNAAFQRQSHTDFVALANANADFVRVSHIPRTERLAGLLSQVLGMEVRFERVAAMDGRHEAVAVNIEPGAELTLIRERPTLRTLVLRPLTLGTLAAFWGLCFALAWAVVRPYLKAQRLALLGQMATALAHEIQNPVAAIRLHGQLLERTQQGEAQGRGGLEARPTMSAAALIVDEATKIEGLVNQWMFLARPDPPRKAAVAVADLLEQSVRLLAPAAEHGRVRLVVDAARDLLVQADARRLGQVFHNIILNAIQAMPTGGTLTILARDHTISFLDTGPGFSPTALRRWAEMLYSEKEGGMGIGLSVAQEIIRAHGGRLTVGNRPEGGAWVSVEL
jgi:signal transduction histidine kinase